MTSGFEIKRRPRNWAIFGILKRDGDEINVEPWIVRPSGNEKVGIKEDLRLNPGGHHKGVVRRDFEV